MTGPTDRGWSVPGLELQLPPKPEHVRTARHAVAALARLHEADDELIEEIKLAVSEACTTAVAEADETEQHTGDALPLTVTASVDGGRMTIDVFDPRGTAPREVAGSPAELDTGDLPFERALSVPIIRGLVDELAIAPQGGGGVRVRMVVGFDRPEG
jgi:serine/threonine-protein kinase RsbW